MSTKDIKSCRKQLIEDRKSLINVGMDLIKGEISEDIISMAAANAFDESVSSATSLEELKNDICEALAAYHTTLCIREATLAVALDTLAELEALQ